MTQASFAIAKRRRSAVVAGATGLVGTALIEALLADSAVGAVHVLVRAEKADWRRRAGLTQHVVDYKRGLSELPVIDDAYCCLGTTIKVAGSQEAFRAVDYDAALSFARAAQAAGATRFGLVSALGANPKSSVFYNRVKGEAEHAIAALGFESMVIARPSLLLGDRTALGQSTRPGEQIAAALTSPLRWLMPRSLRPIEAAVVARALMRSVQRGEPGLFALSSGVLQVLGR
ncbi:MAG TPA: NAD(P)H-binding protein [Burkholderiaceae bacterium]|nr:NAD(P)H-binding protein [Burkholderiaceae bacterium]